MLLKRDSDSAATGDVLPQNIKFLLSGKVLQNEVMVKSVLFSGKRKKSYKIMAIGMSQKEIDAFNESQTNLAKGVRVRDDISDEGRLEVARRMLAGKALNEERSARERATAFTPFKRIETLPMLPERHVATKILTDLANDPGIKECMRRRNWEVGCLAEMYPEGKVGVSDVCVMGLNKNKGETIYIRLRTDDLSGFRKPLSIRKVLFHELTHNEISDHNE